MWLFSTPKPSEVLLQCGLRRLDWCILNQAFNDVITGKIQGQNDPRDNLVVGKLIRLWGSGKVIENRSFYLLGLPASIHGEQVQLAPGEFSDQFCIKTPFLTLWSSPFY
jgi:hypothetical protein